MSAGACRPSCTDPENCFSLLAIAKEQKACVSPRKRTDPHRSHRATPFSEVAMSQIGDYSP
jgi:hypothetical protein